MLNNINGDILDLHQDEAIEAMDTMDSNRDSDILLKDTPVGDKLTQRT